MGVGSGGWRLTAYPSSSLSHLLGLVKVHVHLEDEAKETYTARGCLRLALPFDNRIEDIIIIPKEPLFVCRCHLVDPEGLCIFDPTPLCDCNLQQTGRVTGSHGHCLKCPVQVIHAYWNVTCSIRVRIHNSSGLCLGLRCCSCGSTACRGVPLRATVRVVVKDVAFSRTALAPARTEASERGKSREQVRTSFCYPSVAFVRNKGSRDGCR